MSKLEQIAVFLEVVETNSFAGAARKLGISTAAVSRQISRLEESVSAQLLLRTTRRLALTDIGQQFYEHAKKIANDLTEMESMVAGSKAEATGILRVTSSRYFAMMHIIPRLPEFLRLHPKLKLKFELAERLPDLAGEKIDILFGVSLTPDFPDLVRKRVLTTRYVLCAAPSYLKKFGTPKNPHDLMQHRYITHSMRKPDNVITFKNGQIIRVDPYIWLNDSQAMLKCAKLGMGIIRLHDYMVTEELKSKKLIEVLPSFTEESLSVFLYYQQSRFLLPKIRHFIDFFTDNI